MSVARSVALRLGRWASAKVFSAPPKTLASREYADRFRADWREVYAATPCLRPAPTSFSPATEVLESKLCRVFPAAGVLALQGGNVFGPAGWVVGRDGYWLPEHSWYGRGAAAEVRPAVSGAGAGAGAGSRTGAGSGTGWGRVSGPGELRRLGGTGLTLASNWSCENYGHLLLDSLSRIHLFTQAGFSFAQVDHIYCPAKNPAKATVLLERYGVPVDKCILAPLPEGGGIQFDTLIAPTFPGIRRNYPDWVPAFLRQALPLAHRRELPRRRLYVTRGGGTRKLSNESALVGCLVEAGFEIYDPLEHADPWVDFSQATAVIGPHGAGLTDLAFCPRGTSVLELLPSDHIHPYYCSLSQAAGLRYGYVIGPSERQRRRRAVGPSPYDFAVDEQQFASGVRWVVAGGGQRGG